MIPAGRHRVEDTIERSRFITTIAHAPTAEDARAFIASIREEFPDATHNCWAYVAGPPGSTASIGMSDAGEPHGTAGRPMLDVLIHSAVGEVAAVVTRFFGGTKLGTGGLVRAYGGCVQHALSSAQLIERIERVDVAITISYADVEMLRRLLQEVGGDVTAEEYGADVRYVAAVPAQRLDELRRAVQDRTAGRCTVDVV